MTVGGREGIISCPTRRRINGGIRNKRRAFSDDRVQNWKKKSALVFPRVYNELFRLCPPKFSDRRIIYTVIFAGFLITALQSRNLSCVPAVRARMFNARIKEAAAVPKFAKWREIKCSSACWIAWLLSLESVWVCSIHFVGLNLTTKENIDTCVCALNNVELKTDF